MSQILLSVKGLKTQFKTGKDVVCAVDGVSFELAHGETFALLGESGCGKSMTALSIMRLLPATGRVVSGEVRLAGQELLILPEMAMRKVRGRGMAMIFQEPQSSLNPVLTVGTQIGETLRVQQGLAGRAGRKRVMELLNAVGIPDPKRRLEEYPHQLSGGTKQRIMIAITLAGEPDLLIADEPTTALDVTVQAQVLALLRRLQARTGMAILLITHDLGVVAEMADRVAVMYAGRIVEEATCNDFFERPAHPYSRKLFEAMPKLATQHQRLAAIQGSVPSLLQTHTGCRFEPRCELAQVRCREVVPARISQGNGRYVRCHLYKPGQMVSEQIPFGPVTEILESVRVGKRRKAAPKVAAADLLQVWDLKVHFPIRKGLFKRVVGHVRAVDGISLAFRAGETLALVGESGCGKTTAGKGILQLPRPTAGRVRFAGDELTALDGKLLRRCRKDIQIVFQDSYSSMNPRMPIGDIIEEGMIAQGMERNRASRRKRIGELLRQVGLDPDSTRRYPHEFSGGQRQRICIARALAVEPKLIICDEPTSALDVSVQAQILNLLKGLQDRLGLTYLFITHNLAVVEYMAHEVAVMYLGRIVEKGTVEDVLSSPKHPYTQALVSAIPIIYPRMKREIIRLEGELPSPVQPPSGCHFNPRCRKAIGACRAMYPTAVSLGDGHMVSCHLYS